MQGGKQRVQTTEAEMGNIKEKSFKWDTRCTSSTCTTLVCFVHPMYLTATYLHSIQNSILNVRESDILKQTTQQSEDDDDSSWSEQLHNSRKQNIDAPKGFNFE